MRFHLYIWVVLCLSVSFGSAQENRHFYDSGEPVIRCESHEYEQELRHEFPELGNQEAFEQFLAPHVERIKRERAEGIRQAITTIPIVFHVIHNGQAIGATENVSADLIQAQLDQLNNDFRRVSGTSGFNNDPVGADTEIEFCFAIKDPDGVTLAEPGINRINSVDRGWGTDAFERSFIDQTVKPATIWDRDEYLNVWVAEIGNSLLGWAQFPSNSGLPGLNNNGGPANRDGVVVLFSSIGSTDMNFPGAAPYNKGRTLTHEIGHWLGLRHIWGDETCGNDFCDDTPEQIESSSGNCPTSTTCDGNQDMTKNYMDYSNDLCMNIFTADQTVRMQAVLAASRTELGASAATACDLTGTFVAFKSPAFGCIGNAITFDNDTRGVADSYTWDFGDGSAVSNEIEPSHTYTSAGEYTVTLSVGNGGDSFQAQRQITIGQDGELENFNGGTAVNLSAADLGGTSGYLAGHNSFGDLAKVEFFGEAQEGLALDYIDLRFAVATGSGDVEVVIWDDVDGLPGNQLASKMVSISSIATNGSATRVAFDGLKLNGPFFAGVELNYTDGSDIALFTNEDGDTQPTTAFERWGDNSWHSFNEGVETTWQLDVALAVEAGINPLPTATISLNGSQLVASSNTGVNYQWLRNGNEINGATLPFYTATENGDYSVIVGNALGCTDQSNTITVTLSTVLDELLDASIQVYPNPVRDDLQVSINGMDFSEITMRVVDMAGRTIMDHQLRDAWDQIDVRPLSAGLYMLQFETSDGRLAIKRVTIHK